MNTQPHTRQTGIDFLRHFAKSKKPCMGWLSIPLPLPALFLSFPIAQISRPFCGYWGQFWNVYTYFAWACVCLCSSVSLQKSLVSFTVHWNDTCACVLMIFIIVRPIPLCVTWSHGHLMTIHFTLYCFFSLLFGSFTQNNFQQTITSNSSSNSKMSSEWEKKFHVPRIVTCECVLCTVYGLWIYDKIDYIDNDFCLMTSNFQHNINKYKKIDFVKLRLEHFTSMNSKINENGRWENNKHKMWTSCVTLPQWLIDIGPNCVYAFVFE